MKKNVLLLFALKRIGIRGMVPGLLFWSAGLAMAGDFGAPPLPLASEHVKTGVATYAVQAQLIRGKVVDGSGEPVPGATVLVEGTTIGTATDIDGNFSLDVPEDAVLLVSFIGYKPLRIEVGSQTDLTLTLTEDASALDEVVVVGYGTVERREVTGSIASIGRQEIVSEPVYSFENLLQ